MHNTTAALSVTAINRYCFNCTACAFITTVTHTRYNTDEINSR